MLLWDDGIGIRKISTMQGIKCDIGGKISNFRSRKKNMRKIKQRVKKMLEIKKCYVKIVK